MIRLLDTFAGVGGFHLALEQSIGKENVECIGYCEIDKFAKQVYEQHFPNSPDLGDITKLDIENLPDFDLLTGGFPCQDVSVAGKQSLDGGRTILVEYLLQILEKKQPSYFVFENVKGLMSKKFDTFRESIFERIREAGYKPAYKVLNTKDFGLPQNRERVFIVGQLARDLGDNEILPKGQKLTTLLKDILEEEVEEKYFFEKKIGKEITGKNSLNKIRVATRGLDDIARCLTAGGQTATNAGATNIKIGNRLRKPTPTECERLQGFPDGYTSSVSNTQRYKQMGNAISVPVVKAIFDNLIDINERTT